MMVSISFAQQKKETVSVIFDEITYIDAILLLEEKTDYQFYYNTAWFSKEKLTLSFTEKPFAEILDVLFENTSLNYYITKDLKVILTNYNQIYDVLPNNFFPATDKDRKEDNTNTEVAVSNTFFYNEERVKKTNALKTQRIGKQSSVSNKSEYVLRGNVFNTTNNSPAANVSITIEGTLRGVVTKDDGSFEIILPAGLSILKINALTFRNVMQRVIMYDDGFLDIQLQEEYQGLDEVILDGTANKVLKEVKSGVTKIDVEASKNIPLVLGERDVFKVAATMPGIASAGEGANGYNVRGGKTDQNLILLDDGVIYNPAHFFGIFSAINPFTTNEVSIFKGHVPANYGGRLSSVFDIKTKDANTTKFSGEASIGLVTSNVMLEVPIVEEKAAILVGGRATYSDYILRNLEEEELQNSEASFYDVIFKYNHDIDKNNKIKATGYFSNDAFSVTKDSLLGYSNRMASIRWDHRFNETHKGALVLANSQFKFDLAFDGENNTNFELGYTVNETELKAVFDYKLSKKHQISYGLSTKFYDVSPGFRRPLGAASQIESVRIQDEFANESALYISDVFNVNDKLAIDGGIRFSVFTALGAGTQNIYQEGVPKNNASLLETREFNSGEAIKTYVNPEFRLSARYLIMPDLSVKASFNNAAQYIHRLSTTTTASPVDTWKLSDLNIKPQQGQQYALGLFKNFDANTYELSVEGYYKKSNNILDYKTGATLLLNESIEQEVLQGEGKSYGFEFLLKKTKGKFNGWLGYTYSRSFIKLDSPFSQEQVNNGSYFPSNFDKPHDVSFVGNYKLTRRVSFSANFSYQTGRPVTIPVGNFVIDNTELIVFSDRNEFRIPDYYRLDLGINLEGNHKLKKLAHSFWTLSVYNVLGRNNPYSVFFVAEDGDVKAYQTSIFSIPIPTISYNLKF